MLGTIVYIMLQDQNLQNQGVNERLAAFNYSNIVVLSASAAIVEFFKCCSVAKVILHNRTN